MTCPYLPQQNEVAEHTNHILLDKARAMIAHKNVPNEFWAHSIVPAAYLRNKNTCRALPTSSTPFKAGFGARLDKNQILVFSSLAGIRTEKKKRKAW